MLPGNRISAAQARGKLLDWIAPAIGISALLLWGGGLYVAMHFVEKFW